MAQILKAILFQPEAVPPNWIFQIITDEMPGDFFRTMQPGEESNPTKIALPDPEDPSIAHNLVFYRPKP